MCYELVAQFKRTEIGMDKVIDPRPQPRDAPIDLSLRPRTLEEYIGQPPMIRRLNIAIQAAKTRGEAVTHILFHGGPGLGKTTIASLIAKAMGSQFHRTSGPALKGTYDVLGVLTSLGPRDVLFIDEIHRIPNVIEEFLYPAMEDYHVDFLVDKGLAAKTVTVPLPSFTLVGATTRAGALSAPLRDRFGIVCRMEYYSVEELTRIIRRSAGLLRIEIMDEDAMEIARRARGTPRIANRLLMRVRDYWTSEGGGPPLGPSRITITGILEEAFALEGVDERGLDDLDRRYIDCIKRLYKGGPVGIEALAASLNESRETLEDMVEPYLLHLGLITRTPRGRRAI